MISIQTVHFGLKITPDLHDFQRPVAHLLPSFYDLGANKAALKVPIALIKHWFLSDTAK